jgi:hypothetical protein
VKEAARVRRDQILRQWSFKKMLSPVTPQRGARAVIREYEDKPLGLVMPVYTGKVIRRAA